MPSPTISPVPTSFPPMATPSPNPTEEPTPWPEPTPEEPSADEAPMPSPSFPVSKCFDPHSSVAYAGEIYHRSTDDPNSNAWNAHCLPRWMYGCFGAGAECEVVTPMPLQYGCGGIRARLAVTEDDEAQPAIFDSPLATGRARRRPALVGIPDVPG
jgi:hypothetical protein